VFIGGTHWCLWSLCCIPTMFMGGRGIDEKYLVMFAGGQTPPFVLGFLAFQGEELQNTYSETWVAEMVVFCIIGLITWAVAAMVLANLARARFQQETGRDDQFRVPRRPPEFVVPVLEAVDERRQVGE
jgi:hypothetical protein